MFSVANKRKDVEITKTSKKALCGTPRPSVLNKRQTPADIYHIHREGREERKEKNIKRMFRLEIKKIYHQVPIVVRFLRRFLSFFLVATTA